MKLQAPPVAVRARELGLPLLQPLKIRTEEFLSAVAATKPDCGIVVAYGRILPASLLAIPRHGFLNAHASVLPKWRGAAPIQRSIEAGDRETGVTIMRVDEQLDHGPVLHIERTEIGPGERAPSLFHRLAELGGAALARVLRDLERGVAIDEPQDHSLATLAPKIEKAEGEIDFRESAQAIYNRFRAFDPWPGIFVQSAGETIKLTDIAPAEGSGTARTIVALDGGVVVACETGAIRILEMQRAGKPRTPASAIAHGLGWRAGDRIPD